MSNAEALKLTEPELLRALATSADGLTQKEAARRLAKGGAAPKRRAASWPRILLRQVKSSLVYLLVAAVAIAYAIGDELDGSVILVILLINTALGFYQEYRSERAVEKLERFITREVRVKRGGTFELVPENQVVAGDVVRVLEGDIVTADLRLLEADALIANESALSGESEPVTKRLGSSLYAGSAIEKGCGEGVAFATGLDTRFGEVVRLVANTERKTNYEKSLAEFSTLLLRVILAALIVVFFAKLLLAPAFPITTSLIFIIALAVSTVPEALPVIATVTMARGALALAKHHVVVKRLSALEDLGNVNLLCTDKTGTITENAMALDKIASPHPSLFERFAYAALGAHARGRRRTHNSYADAISARIAPSVRREAEELTHIQELPFDPEERLSRIVFLEKRGAYVLVSMGAPEAVFAVAPTPHRERYLSEISAEGKKGLHHLALAYKEIPYAPGVDLRSERDMEFLGYAAFLDPLRKTAKETIERATRLGIRVKVLTGDREEVAEFVGRAVGLVGAGERVYTGDELAAMDAAAFKRTVERSHIFARVSPAQKYEIIKALKQTYVVAYQGDGINDAPALKLADVAIAVGGATDIAKENADIVLLNRSLEVVVDGIRAGRAVFVNINKYIRYTMSNNFGVLVALGLLYLFSSYLPLLPVQALLNNFFGDIPLVLVSADAVEDDEIVRPGTHDMKELVRISLALGVPTALFGLLYYALIAHEPTRVVQTSLYVFYTFQALIIFFAVRTKKHFWRAKAPSPVVAGAFALSLFASLFIIYLPDFEQWFSFVPLRLMALSSIALCMIAYFLAADLVKTWLYVTPNSRNTAS